MTARVDSHEKTITSLIDTVNNIQETVNVILKIPIIEKHLNENIANKQILPKTPVGVSSATGDGRKSRSRGREQRRRGSSEQRRRGSSTARSKTPHRVPMEQEPSTPSRGIKRRTTESSPTSPEGNEGRAPPPKEAPKNGCDTISPSVKKANRPSSTEDVRSLREEEPLATPPAPEEKPATTPESATKSGKVGKGGKSRPKIITGLKAGKLPSKLPNR